MLKVTCIVGSARDNGSTAYLIDKLISGLSNKAIVKKYVMGNIDLKFCTGCKQCYIDGNCVQNDDVKDIVTNILDSDYVVIASPSYWADVPGQLKTFFDRNTPYGDTNPNRILKATKNIKGIAIAVRAGTRPAENEILLNAIEHYFGHLGIEPIKRISICSTNTLQDLIDNHQKEIQEVYSIGQSMVS
ncbi:MAG: flavodoxin family protein [Clostridia bacterium]|nr:flavodoxin family protein [Clostridia bacterium]